MPSFHTKTIEAILDPVASQVSQLVLLHDASADGSAMPDLSTQIMAVNAAVQNLVRVGKDTTASSKDEILKQDMPPAFTEVEQASNSLVEASQIFKTDPHSKAGRKILIEGSRGILGGTAQLLLVFDQAEVRKILRYCQQVLDYIVVAEVIECLEDLVTFVKNLTPGMTAMAKNVETRSKDLTFQIHRELLEKHLESVKNMVPLLISAIKITVTTINQGGLGLKQAQANRTFVINRMMFDITEIMRVLQLTSYDEDESALDDIAIMKKARDNISNQMKQAKNWLANPQAAPGGVGEGAIRQILADAYKVADRADKSSGEKVRRCADDVRQLMDKLADLRARGMGNSPEALQLSHEIDGKLDTLKTLVDDAVDRAIVSGTGKPPATLTGKMEAAQAWLHSANGAGTGVESIQGLVLEGRKAAEGLSGPEKKELLDLCNEVEALTQQLNDLFRQGKGNTPEAQAIKKKLDEKLQALQKKIEKTLATQIVDLFMDPLGPLKQLEKAAKAPADSPDRERTYESTAGIFLRNGKQITDTAKWVAEAGTCPDKKIVGELNATANEVSEMNPQLVYAGKIVLIHPENAAATDNFEKLRDKYKEKVERMTELIDDATDVVAFIKASEESIKKDSEAAAAAISQRNSPTIVEKGGNIARKANRIAIVANKEADNSEDPEFVKEVRDATSQLEKSVPQIVVSTKGVAMNPANPAAQNDWFKSNGQLLIDIERVKRPLIVIIPIEQKPPPPPPDEMPVRSSQHANLEQAPPPPRNLHSASAPFYQPSDVSGTSPYASQNVEASPIQGDAFSRPQYVGSASRPSEYAPPVPPPPIDQAASKPDAGLLAPSKSAPAVQRSAGRSPKEFSNEDFFPPPPPSFLQDDPTQQPPPPPAPTFVAPSVSSDRSSDVASRLPNTPYRQAEPSQAVVNVSDRNPTQHASSLAQPSHNASQAHLPSQHALPDAQSPLQPASLLGDVSVHLAEGREPTKFGYQKSSDQPLCHPNHPDEQVNQPMLSQTAPGEAVPVHRDVHDMSHSQNAPFHHAEGTVAHPIQQISAISQPFQNSKPNEVFAGGVHGYHSPSSVDLVEQPSTLTSSDPASQRSLPVTQPSQHATPYLEYPQKVAYQSPPHQHVSEPSKMQHAQECEQPGLQYAYSETDVPVECVLTQNQPSQHANHLNQTIPFVPMESSPSQNAPDFYRSSVHLSLQPGQEQDSLHAPQKSLPSHAYPSSQPTPYHSAPSSSSSLSSPSSYRPPSDTPQRAPYYQGTSQRSPGSQQVAPPAPIPSWNHAQASQRGQDQQPVTVDTGVPYSPLVRSPGDQQSYASPFASNRDQSRTPRKFLRDVSRFVVAFDPVSQNGHAAPSPNCFSPTPPSPLPDQFFMFVAPSPSPPPPPLPRRSVQLRKEVKDDVAKVRNVIQVNKEPPLPPPPDISALSVTEEESAPPRPPPPEVQMPPPRPPLPAPDPSADEPIMKAAYDLHVETEKWSSKGNDLIAAAKRMALLMAQMSSYVRNDDQSSKSKKGLIDCAKAIAAASAEVSRLATEIAKQCTDKRIRMNLMQVCERIPTIATQLKIISTVKATLLGDPDAENEGETTEVLVLNAQNLMGAVKETVRQAEAASIKIRTDAGVKLRWVRKSPWYS